jgi:hypothetical protein
MNAISYHCHHVVFSDGPSHQVLLMLGRHSWWESMFNFLHFTMPCRARRSVDKSLGAMQARQFSIGHSWVHRCEFHTAHNTIETWVNAL